MPMALIRLVFLLYNSSVFICRVFQLYVADQLPAPLIIRYGRRMGLVVEREILK